MKDDLQPSIKEIRSDFHMNSQFSIVNYQLSFIGFRLSILLNDGKNDQLGRAGYDERGI